MPNPFTDRLNIQFAIEKAGRVKIYLSPVSGSGNITLTNELYTAGSHAISVSPSSLADGILSPGMYILSMESAAMKQKCKLIKISGQ